MEPVFSPRRTVPEANAAAGGNMGIRTDPHPEAQAEEGPAMPGVNMLKGGPFGPPFVRFYSSPNTGGSFRLCSLRLWKRSITAFSPSLTSPPSRYRSMAA